MRIGWILLVWACTGDANDLDSSPTGSTPPDTDGACGALTEIDVAIRGAVVDTDERPIAGAEVRLEERVRSPGRVHGSGPTDGAGRFAFDGLDLPVLEDCWGTAVQYWIVAQADGLTGEKHVNTYVQSAVEDGTYEVDVSAFPIHLE